MKTRSFLKLAITASCLGLGIQNLSAQEYNPQLASITSPRGAAWPDGPPEVGLSDIPLLTVGPGGNNKWEILKWDGNVPGVDYVPKDDYPSVSSAKSEGWFELSRPNTHLPQSFTGGGKFIAMRTSVVSKQAIAIQINVKGDDGTALFVNGSFISGGGTSSEQNVGTIQFPANTPVEICAIVSNGGGPIDIALQVPVGVSKSEAGPEGPENDPPGPILGPRPRAPGPFIVEPIGLWRTNMAPTRTRVISLPFRPKAQRAVVRSEGTASEPQGAVTGEVGVAEQPPVQGEPVKPGSLAPPDDGRPHH